MHTVDDHKLIDLIPDDGETLEEKTIISNLSNEINILLNKCYLSDREKKVIILRYGLDGKGQKTLEEVGALLGNITRQRVKQLEAKALKKIRMSNLVRDFAIYMDKPDRAIENIDSFKKEYLNSDLNKYKLSLNNNDTKYYNCVKDRVRK